MAQIWLIVVDGFELFDVAAAIHVFEAANVAHTERHGRSFYEIHTFVSSPMPVRGAGCAFLNARELPSDVSEAIHTVMVIGGGALNMLGSSSTHARRAREWIFEHRSQIDRIASVGTIGFTVADAAHQRTDPSDARRLWDAVAASSGMKLALKMVADDLGQPIAISVTAQLGASWEPIATPFRFRSDLAERATGDSRVIALHAWMVENLHERLSVDRLADRLSMSPRTFGRFYLRTTGITPARALEQLRLSRACDEIETTPMSFKAIALRCGFSAEEVMRRAFLRVLKMSPSEYRRQYGPGLSRADTADKKAPGRSFGLPEA